MPDIKDLKNISENISVIPEEIFPRSKWYKWPLIIWGIVLFLAILVFGTSYAYLKFYNNKIYPGVFVGNYHIGGLKQTELKTFTEQLNNRLARGGFVFSAEDKDGKIHEVKINNLLSGSDAAVELVNINSDVLANTALKIGRTGNWFEQLFAPLYYRLFVPQKLNAPLIIDKVAFIGILKDNFSGFTDRPHNANFIITNTTPLSYKIQSEKSGQDYDYENIYNQITGQLSNFIFDTINIKPHLVSPTVVTSDLSSLATKLPGVLSYGDLSVNFIDPQTNMRKDWIIAPAQIANWITADKDSDGFYFRLNDDKLNDFLKAPETYINRPAIDAKFEMTDGRVTNLQTSQTGIKLDIEATAKAVNQAFRERNNNPQQPTKSVSALVETVEPNVSLSTINDMGITDILGVGVSTFHDSHTNRIKNIANAVKRLNGILIKPDEDFSANKYAGPYTLENGFMPEEVIKGDKIKKEVGGGMCQIGTTLFRMAMNSGMDIIQRRNHSLVVSYYSDPINGNPGTDAALYEPDLDLKFKNDTGHYLLLQTSIDYVRQELRFTLWGHADGRKGWYTHPEVTKWIPAGPEQTIVNNELKPGEKKCQNAFTGAVAKFTYSRVTGSGEKIDRVFDSYYRPLPKLCLVGPTTGSSTVSSPALECIGDGCLLSPGTTVTPASSSSAHKTASST